MQAKTPPPGPRRAQGLAHDLVASLTREILCARRVPGDKMPSESVIAREHGVSRTVVREAISQLQASGLVETRHGIGTFVLEREPAGFRLNSATATSIRGILELRMGLETQAAALAARRRTEAHLQSMREALDDYERSLAHHDDSIAADLRFHRVVAEATGNSYFSEILFHLGQSLIPRARILPEERGDSDLASLGQMANREHEAIFQAIRRQDVDAARAAMWLHLSNSLERVAPE